MVDVALTPPNSAKLRAALPFTVMAKLDPDDDLPLHPRLSHTATTAVRRAETPPRDDDGNFYCRHRDCSGKTPTFRRACEWNKHMDRHERPYKCEHESCVNSIGFTYSGGLLRHQREVHRWHQTTKSRIFCPFTGCPRDSSGEGFSRKENLEEHKRRRHADETIPLTQTGDSSHDERSSTHGKRKRLPTPVPSEYSVSVDIRNDEVHGNEESHTGLVTDTTVEEISTAPIEAHPIVKRLRQEVQHSQDHIQRLTRDNHILRMQMAQYYNAFQSMPQQIYSVVPSNATTQQGGPYHMNGSNGPV